MSKRLTRRELVRANEKLEGQNMVLSTALTNERRISTEQRRLVNDQSNFRDQIVNHAINPPDELAYRLTSGEIVFCSVDGPNGAGKDTLLIHLDYAMTASGIHFIALKESRDIDPLAEIKRAEAKRHSNSIRREQTIGHFVTAGRIAGLPELVRRLSAGPGIYCLNRYFSTTLAYQVGVAGADINAAIGLIDRSYMLPHVAIILNCDPEVAKMRECERREREQRSSDSLFDLGKRVAGFAEIGRHIPKGYIIDTTKPTALDVTLEVVNTALSHYLTQEQRNILTTKLNERYRSSN